MRTLLSGYHGGKGVEEMFAVAPLPWCPHLVEVQPLPAPGINVREPCSTCADRTENWVCLVCYKVECSRFVNQHMVRHKEESGHSMALSFSDLSVWCYTCDSYVDNEVLAPIKSSAHLSKFGEPL
ncbi:Histone deacetylase 6 [Bulinus truncatus]|nr:Histone deacetylase 6 [Bulinus truncatus]